MAQLILVISRKATKVTKFRIKPAWNRSSHQKCSQKKRYSWKFDKFYRKTPVLESLFNKVAETPTQVFSCEICQIFKKTYFEEHLRKTFSVGNRWN